MLVLRWNQRAHYWFLGRPKGHIRGPKGHSALWKRPSENPDVDTMVLTAIQWFPPEWRICIKLEWLTKDRILQAPYALEIRIKLNKLLYRMNMGIVDPLSSKKVIFVFLRQLCVPNLDPVIPIITCNNDNYYTVLSLTDIDNNHFEAYLLEHACTF